MTRKVGSMHTMSLIECASGTLVTKHDKLFLPLSLAAAPGWWYTSAEGHPPAPDYDQGGSCPTQPPNEDLCQTQRPKEKQLQSMISQSIHFKFPFSLFLTKHVLQACPRGLKNTYIDLCGLSLFLNTPVLKNRGQL